MKNKEIIISTKGLTIGYTKRGKKNVLIENINIDIPKGQLTAVIGLNGVGKSTFIRTLAKQQPQLSGLFSLNLKDAHLYNYAEWAREIAWVQTDALPPLNLIVEEFIALGRQPYTNWIDKLSYKDKEIVNTVIKNATICDLRKKKCAELSDGQLQRVFIARALAQDTPVIILDEPTTHLDIIHKIKTLDLLKSLCQTQNKTIIYTTHEIELSLQVIDNLICVSENSISINTVKNSIENDAINSLFKYEKLFFDKKSNRFKII